MKWIIIGIIVLIGLMDYALLIACSHLEDEEQYKYEEWLRRKDDEGLNQERRCDSNNRSDV